MFNNINRAPDIKELNGGQGEDKKSEINTAQEFERLNKEDKFKTADTIGKIKQLQDYSDSNEEKERLQHAINLMIKLHIDQKDRPQEPYLNHTSNVALRIIKEYKVINNDLIIAAMLHDSVEDQSLKLAQMLNIKSEISDREKSLTYLSNNFGSRVAEIISALSNPEPSGGETPYEKNKIYAEHVKEIIKDPDVALIKLSDFSENALRLHEIKDAERRFKLSQKYSPVMQIFIDRLRAEHKHQIPIEMNEFSKDYLINELERASKEMVEFCFDYVNNK